MSGGQSPPAGTESDPISLFIGEHLTYFVVVLAAILVVQIWRIARPLWAAHSLIRKSRFREKVTNAVRLSRTKTGYIGAFLAKKTVSVTLHIFGVSIAIHLLGVVQLGGYERNYTVIVQYVILAFIIVNIILAIYAAVFVLRICQEIVRQIEEEDNQK